jgi:hypothetical protein
MGWGYEPLWHFMTKKVRNGQIDCGEPDCGWCKTYLRSPLMYQEERLLRILERGHDADYSDPEDPY